MKRLLLTVLLLISAIVAEGREQQRRRPPPEPTSPAAAATTTANGASCTTIQPFYWEIGDATGKIAGGSVGGTTFGQQTLMSIASASKIFYAAYVEEKRDGNLSAEDIQLMTFRSGYSDFTMCRPNQTTGQCASQALLVPADIGKFAYSGGHMQRHAADVMHLELTTATTLAAEISATIGVNITYSQPQPAGGIITTAEETAKFLRAVMSDRLVLGTHLADHAVPTRGLSAANSPVPETWHYGIGHWIEDSPGNDGAFSSPGAFGFYPWISSDKRIYGVIARKASKDAVHPAWASVLCGRLIRAAYQTGVPK